MIEMVEVQSGGNDDIIWIFTDSDYKEKIKTFIEENYGKTTLECCNIEEAILKNIKIAFPRFAVGLDVLIRFIADLEFEEEEGP
jgi:hypothetical protein